MIIAIMIMIIKIILIISLFEKWSTHDPFLVSVYPEIKKKKKEIKKS